VELYMICSLLSINFFIIFIFLYIGFFFYIWTL